MNRANGAYFLSLIIFKVHEIFAYEVSTVESNRFFFFFQTEILFEVGLLKFPCVECEAQTAKLKAIDT